MAIVNRVPELVAEKFGGIDKVNLSAVEQETGLSYAAVSRWVKDRVDRVDFDSLDKWCEYLECEPGDILKRI